MGEQQMGGTAAAPQLTASGASTGAGAGAGAAPLTNAPMNGAVHTFRDTTYTKVFVGGLAWETQRETMRRHFEQYGEIVEAVVIMDKNTGRSKGYGFVTFRDAEGARKACVDATPVIDGRRANCNLAALGAHRSRPATPLHGNRMIRGTVPYSPSTHAGGGPTFLGSPAYPHQTYYPNYHIYGFSPYLQDYGYQQGVYNAYGVAQYHAQMYAGAMGGPAAYNPYGSMHFMQPVQGTTGGAVSACGAATYPFSTSSPGGSSNSSGNSHHGSATAGAVASLANLLPFSTTAHCNIGSAALSAQQHPPPLLSSANVTPMAIGSSPPLFVVPPPTMRQHLPTTSKIPE